MAISDVLHDAEKGLSFYLKKSDGGTFKERLKSLLEEMDAIRFLPGFDTPPDRPAPPKRTAKEIIEDFTSDDTVSEAFNRASEAQPTPIAPADGALETLVGPGSSSAKPKNPLKGFEEK
jgi:hypothetical protein